MTGPQEPFCWHVRVYWEDTDAGGVVYYANYLRFLERARTEWLRALGIEQSRLLAEDARQFAIVDLAIRYRRPARYDDLLAVSVVYAEHTRASISLNQEIRHAYSGELIVDANVRAACLDSRTLKPRPLPAVLLEEIAT